MQLQQIPDYQGFLGGANGKESACQYRRDKRQGFDPWVRKIPWRRKWQPTPVDRGSWWAAVHEVAELDTTEHSAGVWGSKLIRVGAESLTCVLSTRDVAEVSQYWDCS